MRLAFPHFVLPSSVASSFLLYQVVMLFLPSSEEYFFQSLATMSQYQFHIYQLSTFSYIYCFFPFLIGIPCRKFSINVSRKWKIVIKMSRSVKNMKTLEILIIYRSLQPLFTYIPKDT